ncbi:helix-turn-helix domain-containing protein [Streptomyces sp. HSW2009]|uniref:helix-turn-helix domain-containing protein n=1 Tax=Streptomyces sp. HSW2009 TaxID=3142890 RepID=UPI0032ED5C99
MPEPANLGDRLTDIRKRRGLSQQALADASGVSLSTIRKLEQHQSPTARLATVQKLAMALRVTTTDILKRGDAPTNPEPAPAEWLPVRQAVELPPPTSAPDESPTLESVQAAAGQVRDLRAAAHLSDAAILLPHVMRDAEALGDQPGARDIRAYALQLAGSLLTQTHQYETATTALEQALAAAQDQHRAASIVGTMCWLHIRQGHLHEARTLATRWADDVEPRMSRASADDLAAWGQLLLSVAAAAVRDARTDEAKDALRLARGAAVMTGCELPLGARMDPWGPLTVAYKRSERHMVLDQPDKVLDIAADTEARTPAASRMLDGFNRHRLDVAAAHTRLRDYAQAVKVLTGIQARVPEWLAQQRYAQDVVQDVVARRRTLTTEMRQLADTVRLPL